MRHAMRVQIQIMSKRLLKITKLRAAMQSGRVVVIIPPQQPLVSAPDPDQEPPDLSAPQ